MTDDEKREQRSKLRALETSAQELVNSISSEINDLCHKFKEYELLTLGWTKDSFSGPYMAYEYGRNGKTIIFLEKDGRVLSYSGSPTKFFEDIQDLIEYGF